MDSFDFDRDEIERLTEEYGGQWGINHTRRLLQLIAVIGERQTYDADVVWVAAHLHDWGGYGDFKQKGADHALRSRQVAEPFLNARDFPDVFTATVLTCIETHHSGDPNRCIEAVLLSDADMLDFLGPVGILRDFSKNPRNLRAAYNKTKSRLEKLPAMLCLDKSKEIAAQRAEAHAHILKAFEEQAFGHF
jgi:uncharacterized protein